MAWTDEMVDQLREMWKQGLTTGEIGRRLGVSKNSIVGKVHRLGLSGRPSPIKKKDSPEPQDAPKAKEETAAPQAKTKAEKKPATPKAEKVEKKVEKSPEKPAEEALLIEEKSSLSPAHHHNGKTSLTDLDNHTCRWPIGDPKDENFHFCGKKVRIGQTYCDEHAAIAYVKAVKK